jgi:hypothetical protein
MTTIHDFSERNGQNNRQQRETRANETNPDHREIKLNTAISGAAAHQRQHGLQQEAMQKERDDQAEINIVILLAPEQCPALFLKSSDRLFSGKG